MGMKKTFVTYGIITGVTLGTLTVFGLSYVFRKNIPSFKNTREQLTALVDRNRGDQFAPEPDQPEIDPLPDNKVSGKSELKQEAPQAKTNPAEVGQNNLLASNLNKPKTIQNETINPQNKNNLEKNTFEKQNKNNAKNKKETVESTFDDYGLFPSRKEKSAVNKRTSQAQKRQYDSYIVETKKDDSLKNINKFDYNINAYGPIVLTKPQSRVLVSLDKKFKRIYVRGYANKDGVFQVPNPPPGAIYWKTTDSASSVHEIKIAKPLGIELKLQSKLIMTPEEFISWSSNENVSFYRLEAARNSDFTHELKVFSTKKNDLPVKEIGDGASYIRVSGLNTTTGSWEYSEIRKVQVTN